jgi:hypothetical protein
MRKGSHMSEESKKKISISMIEVRKTINPMKGRTGERHHNFGKPMSEEQKKKLSDAHKGKPSNRKGTHHTEETKRKISESKKGTVAWNKGLKTGSHTKEHKQNISNGVLEWWENASGEIISERNRKIAESKQGQLGHIGYSGQYYIKSNGQKIWLRSFYEVRVAKMLDYLQIIWEYEPRSFDLGGHYYHPDFYLPDYNIWWEVKGYLGDKDREKLNKFYNKYLDENLKLVFNDDIEILERCTKLSDISIINFGKDMCDFLL